MRMILIQAPRGTGRRVLDLARRHQGVNLSLWETSDGDGLTETLMAHVSNRRVGPLLNELQELPDTRITLIPRGVMALRPPPGQAPQQSVDVQLRSPVEVFLGGLQSIGSWKGFLGYAVASGIVAWVGLYTETIYLLVAAMLIAPYAGPAMNAAIATARGDRVLLLHALLRYFAGLGASIGAAVLLTLLPGARAATDLMEQVSRVSLFTSLLPLAAGFAGALNLVESQRNSLVSGAAAGIMVAAALSPPAGVAGMALVLGRWDMLLRSLFLLFLQLVLINTSGAVVFRLAGLSLRGTRYQRGTPGTFAVALGVSLVLAGLLLSLQFATAPELQMGSLSRRASVLIEEEVRASGLADLLTARTQFAGNPVDGRRRLVAQVTVHRGPDRAPGAGEIRRELARRIHRRLAEALPRVVTLLTIEVLESPPAVPGPP